MQAIWAPVKTFLFVSQVPRYQLLQCRQRQNWTPDLLISCWTSYPWGHMLLYVYNLQRVYRMNISFNSYSASHDNWCTATLWNRIMTAQCEGMGEVGSARYEPALLPPCPSIRALCYSNCQRSTQSHQQSKGQGSVHYLWPEGVWWVDTFFLPIDSAKPPPLPSSGHK